LNCGAAAGTEVVEPRGWKVPLYLGGGLAALAVIGVILAIVALASRNDVVADNPTPTPSASAAPPGASTTPPPLATGTPLPSVTASPSATTDPNVSPTPTTDPNVSPSPTATATESATPSPTATEDPGTTDDGGTGDTGTGSTFAEWTGADGDYTIIVESAKTKAGAEKVAQKASDAGESPGILESSNYSSLNGGYWVVFIGQYSKKSEAQDALDGVRSTFKDAYVRQIKS
jgi:septal ring-binding cell division protein DamX